MNGGVEYRRVDLDASSTVDGPRVERWETTKVVADPAEHERAVKIRGKASNLIRGACTRSDFGLLCPSANEEALDARIAEARQLVAEFNRNASTISIGVYALKGRIAESDNEAARAILSEMRELLGQMRNGIRMGDIASVREAASQAKRVALMLDPDTQKTIEAAVDEARVMARRATQLADAGPDAVKAYAESVTFDALDESRFAFLDTDEPAAPVAAAAAEMPDLDFGTDDGESDGGENAA
jgi:hypothetical protein